MTIAGKSRLPAGVPSVTQAQPQSKKEEAFIRAAPRKDGLPWMQPGVRDDLQMALNTRVSERTFLMLDWFADQTNTPKRQIVETALNEWMSRQAKILRIDDV